MNKPIERQERMDIESVLGLEAPERTGWKRWQKLGLGAAVLMTVAAAYAYWSYTGKEAGVHYTTEAAARGNLTVIVTATGSLQPTTKVEISSELSGTVRKVNVDYNSKVEAGAVLAELDLDKTIATVDSSRAKLAAAKAKVTEAEATVVQKDRILARKKTLAGKQFASELDLDTAEADYQRAVAEAASAKADVGVAEADLKLNETNLTKSKIITPISGIVLQRNVDPGQTVASSLQAPVLFSIAEDLRQMELQVDVDEADVGKVKVGQTATFSVDAFPDRRFPATIRDVRYASETIQGVVTYKAVLTIDNSELLLRPGMTATAEIMVLEIKDALLAPNAALRYRPPANGQEQSVSFLRRILPGPPRFRPASARDETGPNRTIWVLRGGQPAEAKVVIGSSDGKLTEIKEGELKPGDLVITDQSNNAK